MPFLQRVQGWESAYGSTCRDPLAPSPLSPSFPPLSKAREAQGWRDELGNEKEGFSTVLSAPGLIVPLFAGKRGTIIQGRGVGVVIE
jgi:hypothetical protein